MRCFVAFMPLRQCKGSNRPGKKHSGSLVPENVISYSCLIFKEAHTHTQSPDNMSSKQMGKNEFLIKISLLFHDSLIGHRPVLPFWTSMLQTRTVCTSFIISAETSCDSLVFKSHNKLMPF